MEWCAAELRRQDVVDVCGGACAVAAVDLADVAIAVEDCFADDAPPFVTVPR